MKPVLYSFTLALALVPRPGLADEVLIFAAASLKEAMEEVAQDWEEATGHDVILSLAGSSVLARQIQAGAPADLFISANTAWADALENTGSIRAGTRRDLLTNALVVIGHGVDAAPVALDNAEALAARLDGGRLATALVDAVPAGIYAKAALNNLGLWEGVAPHVAQTDNVRAALALVASGEAPLGIVYATDALAEDDVSVVAHIPDESHPPITYPALIPIGSTSTQAEALLDYLTGDAASSVFRAHGFGIAGQAEG